MVMGDLNDEVEAATTQILDGPPGSEISTTGFDHPDKRDTERLWNLAPRIPAAQRFSRIYRGRKELIDHIFVSQALVGKVAQDHVTTDAAGPTPPPPTAMRSLRDASQLNSSPCSMTTSSHMVTDRHRRRRISSGRSLHRLRPMLRAGY